MKSRDVMSSEPNVATIHDTVMRAAQLMLISDTGFLPVVDDIAKMRLRGVLTDYDIVMRYVALNRAPNTLVKDVMSEHVVCVYGDDEVHDVVDRMRHQHVRRVPVIGEDRRVIGVVARSDILRGLGQLEARAADAALEAMSLSDTA